MARFQPDMIKKQETTVHCSSVMISSLERDDPLLEKNDPLLRGNGPYHSANDPYPRCNDHSILKLRTGFANAAFMDCILIVNRVIIKAPVPVAAKTHHDMSVR